MNGKACDFIFQINGDHFAVLDGGAFLVEGEAAHFQMPLGAGNAVDGEGDVAAALAKVKRVFADCGGTVK